MFYYSTWEMEILKHRKFNDVPKKLELKFKPEQKVQIKNWDSYSLNFFGLCIYKIHHLMRRD